MVNILLYIVISLKFVVPVFMLKFPFWGVWGNYFLDVLDGDVLHFLGMGEFTYQTMDKAADLWSYVFMLFLGLRFRIKRLVIILFAYRLVGQILFFMTRDEKIFFYFQNFLEPLMMAYTLLLLVRGSEAGAYKTYKEHIVLIWVIIIAYKVWNEWYLHIANVDLSTFFFGING